jgi:hypothetical protein
MRDNIPNLAPEPDRANYASGVSTESIPPGGEVGQEDGDVQIDADRGQVPKRLIFFRSGTSREDQGSFPSSEHHVLNQEEGDDTSSNPDLQLKRQVRNELRAEEESSRAKESNSRRREVASSVEEHREADAGLIPKRITFFRNA